ncbi:MAG: hypothetical protein JXR37_13560 [Kiritimatiellae bacterium]|nr:hypothetical protein [Kiritimatiellia bacterium]
MTETGKPDGSFRLSLLSYNIRHGRGMDDRVDLQRIAAVIRSVQADIAALQEVDGLQPRSGGIDQAEALARATGMAAVWGPAIQHADGRKYGNVLLTRLPYGDVREGRAMGTVVSATVPRPF